MPAETWIHASIETIDSYRRMVDGAVQQLTDEEFFGRKVEGINSVAVILRHLGGNLLSRWTDFLTTDGEKPDRNRDMEFVIEPKTGKEDVLAYWEKGWQRVFDTLESLSGADLGKKVTIRGEEHTVIQAINRQLMHYSYHIGQIVFLAKHFRSSEWKSLSIPRNKSLAFNQYLGEHEPASGTEHRFDAASKLVQESE